jgi:hypothetical protein
MRSVRIAAPSRWVATAALVALVGCSKSSPEPVPTASSASVASATAPVASTAGGADAGVLAPTPGQVPILDRFHHEATARPTGVPRIEDCLAAFKKAGVEIRDEKQHLAAPFLAMYCVGFQTGNDVHGSLCEYKDVETATKGRDTSDKGFASVPNRKVHRNGGSTFTVRAGVATPANDELVKKMAAAFMAVKPATGPAPIGTAPSPFAGASAVPLPPDQPLP